MKRTLICILLLGVMTAAGITLDAHTERVTADISARLIRLSEAPDADEARRISEDWERFCSDNIFLTNNECAFEISKALVHIAADIGGDVADDCRETAMLLDIYDRSREFSLVNIF